MESDNHDSRWICWQCADLDYLNSDGLCSTCAPEQVVEWWQVVIRAVAGEPRRVERQWRVG